MAILNADQRNYLYLLESARVGIHKSILAALYAVHNPNARDNVVPRPEVIPQPQDALSEEEAARQQDAARKEAKAVDKSWMGMIAYAQVNAAQLNTFQEQVQVAATTIRSLTDQLVSKKVPPTDLWDGDAGRYGDGLLKAIAKGYKPDASERGVAQLHSSDFKLLKQFYVQDSRADLAADKAPQNLAYIDPALLNLAERIPRYYRGLPNQRDALLEAGRIWRNLPDHRSVIESLGLSETAPPAEVNKNLVQFLRRISTNYAGYPHQREALLRLAQFWRQLNSREAAIASLKRDTSPRPNLDTIDPALLSFVQRVPQYYQGKGAQRNALTEAFRLWRQLDSRSTALMALGVKADVFSGGQLDSATVQQAASQLDRRLLDFVRRIPANYGQSDHQRQSLVRLIQLWRETPSQAQVIDSLVEEVKAMAEARPNTPEAPPKPKPVAPPKRPQRWTPRNIQLYASIVPGGSFTWAEATSGGTRMPPNQATVNSIVSIAKLAQQARDRIDRTFVITSWFRPPEVNQSVGGAPYSRHIVGDAIDFYVDGLTGNQLYWSLDPWWPGGLGRYTKFPYLCHLDARSYRARWTH